MHYKITFLHNRKKDFIVFKNKWDLDNFPFFSHKQRTELGMNIRLFEMKRIKNASIKLNDGSLLEVVSKS